MLLMTAMWPSFLSSIWGSTCLVRDRTASTFNSRTSLSNSTDVSSNSARWERPALFTRMSIYKTSLFKLGLKLFHIEKSLFKWVLRLFLIWIKEIFFCCTKFDDYILSYDCYNFSVYQGCNLSLEGVLRHTTMERSGTDNCG